MHTYALGKPVGFPTPREGFELRMQGGPQLLLIFSKLGPKEIQNARKGLTRFGVVVEEGVLFFL